MITIGKNEAETFEWSPHDELHGRLGIISKNIESSVLQGIMSKMKTQGQNVFRITTVDPQLSQLDELNVIEFEQYPAHSKDDSGFSIARMNWVQQYFNLLSFVNRVERKDFVPAASFRAHAEGPLIGYIRAIENSTVNEAKVKLTEHIMKLNRVKWFMNDDGEMVYLVSGDTEEEMLESLFIGAWSFWSFTPHIVSDTPINLVLELDGPLMKFPVLNEKRTFLSFITETLARLTFELQMSYIVKSPTLFPLPESLIEHILIEDLTSEDMDWSEMDNFPPSIGDNEVIWLHKQVSKLIQINLPIGNEYDKVDLSE